MAVWDHQPLEVPQHDTPGEYWTMKEVTATRHRDGRLGISNVEEPVVPGLQKPPIDYNTGRKIV